MVLIKLSVAEHRWQVKQCRTFAGIIEITNIEALGLKPVRLYLSARKFPRILSSDWNLASAVRVSQLTGWPMTWPILAFTYLRFVCRCRSPKLIYNIRNFIPPMKRQPLIGQDLQIVEVSRSHSDIPHSVKLLWTGDQRSEETSTWQNTTLTRERHPCIRRGSNLKSQKASGRRPTP
jgi:hypothetical protein